MFDSEGKPLTKQRDFDLTAEKFSRVKITRAIEPNDIESFSLQDIETIVKESQQGHSPCPIVRELMHKRLAEIEQKIAAMQATYQKMKHSLKHWQDLPNCVPTGNHVCHLIENFSCEECSDV